MMGVVVETATKSSAAGHVELPEHLAQVVFDGARADEQLGTDLRIRVAVTRQARDLELLRRERVPVVGGDPARGLAGGDELASRPLGERVGAHATEALVRGAQLLARVDPTVLTAGPLAVHQPTARELDRSTTLGELGNRLLIRGFVVVQQGMTAGFDAERPRSAARARTSTQTLVCGRRVVPLSAANAGLDQFDERAVEH